MKKVKMSERKPPIGDHLTNLGWLTYDGTGFHYRNLPRHKVSEASIDYWIEDTEGE